MGIDFCNWRSSLTLRIVSNKVRGTLVAGATAFAALVVLVGPASPALAQASPISPVATNVTAFVGVTGSPAQSVASLGYPLFNFGAFTSLYPAAPADLTNSVRGFFDLGGTQMSVYPATSNTPADLIAAIKTTATPVNGALPANTLVVPAISSLVGDDYYRVAIELNSMAAVLPAMAVLDLPLSVVQTSAATQDPTGPVEVADTLARMLPSPATAVVYGSPLRDADSGIVPAAGLMAGVYATSDNLSGVWAQPAGADLPLSGYVAQWLPDDEAMDQLATAGINSFVLGAAADSVQALGALTLEPTIQEKRYISEVRLGQFMATSVSNGLRWAAFEPAGPRLWAQANLAVTEFMTSLNNQGAFGSATIRQPFFVVINQSNNSVADMTVGVVNIDVVYRSPTNPAVYLPLHVTVEALKGM